MQCKTGAEHISSLKDGRTAYIDGALVDDVTTHPAFRNAVASASLLPSSCRDWELPAIAPIIHKTQRLANFDPPAKVKLLKAAWDAIGSEFASRHTQYEMFYAGARFVTNAHSYRTYDWAAARGMVDDLLSTYGLHQAARSDRA